MFAAHSITEYSAKAAEQQCTSCARRMQNPSPRMSTQAACGMWTIASAAASILLIQTGVVASVSLFVLLVILVSLLLVGLIGLPGVGSLEVLSLSCLTGLNSLVGLVKGLSPGTNAGD